MIAIAVDGPSGAGKSTISRALARRRGYTYMDTGALYRAIGLYALRHQIDPKDEKGVSSLLPDIKLELCYHDDGQHVLLCGEDVSGEIRTPQVSMAASGVSAVPAVRAFLVDLQRKMAETRDVIMDGRDIGTVILPNAQVKIFLTASSESRARRRFEELCQKGENVTYEEVLADVKKRDEQDSGRAIAPLRPAEDAHLVDTTGNTLEESIEQIDALIGRCLAAL